MPSSLACRNKVRVLLCDDHAMVREGTKRILEEEPDIEVVGEAADGEEAVELARRLLPDVVAMDVSMPRLNGIEATRQIKQENPGIAVLVLTAYDDFAYVSRLLENGASGYLLKSAGAEELVLAIRALAAGECVLDRNVAKEVFSRVRRHVSEEAEVRKVPFPAPVQPLTPKELEVLRLAAEGLANKEIAKELRVSPRTVQAHLASIFSKLGVASRTEAVVAALRAGLLGTTGREGRS